MICPYAVPVFPSQEEWKYHCDAHSAGFCRDPRDRFYLPFWECPIYRTAFLPFSVTLLNGQLLTTSPIEFNPLVFHIEHINLVWML